nr:putative membrane protein [Cedratvirus lena]WIL04734.1 putative membrane protein [Cedratvirus duvanny]
MNVPLLLAIVLLILVIVFVIIIYVFPPSTTTVTNAEIREFLQNVQRRTGFSEPERLPGNRGNCSIYTFPGQITEQVSIVDELTPQSLSSVIDCYDEDQGFLQKTTITCQRENDVCISPDGESVAFGDSVYLYAKCISNVQPCVQFDQSYLAALSLNGRCVIRPSLDLEPCMKNLGKNSIFRITHALPVTLTGNSDGPYVRILNRENGLCLVPSNLSPSSGTSVVQASCEPNSGYTWWYVPGLSLSRIVDGKVENVTSPPQLVYISSVGPPPENPRDYFSNPGNRALSLQVSNDGKLVLLPFTLDRSAGTEFLKYSIYS